jgi:hypothetical protein
LIKKSILKEMSFENEHIKEEDFIRSLKGSGGFETPQDYFENNLKKLQEISKEPNLGLNDIKGGFETPPLYFENLNAQILSKVNQPKKGKKLSLFPNVNWVNYAAACLVFGLIVFGVMQMNSSNQTETAKIEDLTEDEIIEHLSNTGFREEMLCDAGWCDELNKLENSSEIENYLLEEGAENELIDEING